MIHLDGLTKHQVELLDQMWVIQDSADVSDFISSLSEQDQFECQLLVNLISLELIDQEVDEMDDWSAAATVIGRVMY